MQSPDVVVRVAEDADLEKIARDYGTTEPRAFNPFASVDRLKQLPREGLLVAEFKGKYAGFIYWIRTFEARERGRGESTARIVTVRLSRTLKEESVAVALLRRVLKDIDEADVKTIVVDAEGSSPSSVGLFERLGFYTFDRTLHMRYLYPADRKRTQRPHSEVRELAVFMVEVREQCRMFMTACSELEDLISKGPPLEQDGQRIFSAKVWFRIQAALSACAVISKIMWPNPTRKRDDSDELGGSQSLKDEAHPQPLSGESIPIGREKRVRTCRRTTRGVVTSAR